VRLHGRRVAYRRHPAGHDHSRSTGSRAGERMAGRTEEGAW
jgi:hypothetical protein